MTMRARILTALLCLVPAFAVAGLSIYRPAIFGGLQPRVYDALLTLVPLTPPDPRVVIVDVDDRSLSAIGQWPWRRDIIGDLVKRLRGLGASVVALDIIFAEPDRYARDDASSDDRLVEQLQAGRAVVGYALTFDRFEARGDTCLQHPVGLAIVRGGGDEDVDPFFRATGAICSLVSLTTAAGASGFLNATPDADGRLRRAPLLLELDGNLYPSLALAAVSALNGEHYAALRVLNVNASLMEPTGADGSSIPLDGKGNLLLRYRGGRSTFPYISALEVLSGEADPDAFTGRLVFVGTTAIGTREVASTPFDTQFARVEVQATVADNLLQRDFLHPADHGVLIETLLVLGLGLGLAVVVGRMGITWGAVGAALSVSAVWIGAFSLLATRGVWVSPLPATLCVAIGFAAIAVPWFAFEHRRADRAVHDKTTSQRLMVQTLLSLTSVRDSETGEHSRRTRRYTGILARQLAGHPSFRRFLTPDKVELLSSLAPLHDIGKVGVPDRLLNKRGTLTAKEFTEIRKHPASGRDVIQTAQHAVGVSDDPILTLAKDIVYTHHERWDGSGYPRGLKGPEIPISGRVIALVDVYDAMRTWRPYREALAHDTVVDFIIRGRGSHFDPDVVDAFLAVSDALRTHSDERTGGRSSV